MTRETNRGWPDAIRPLNSSFTPLLNALNNMLNRGGISELTLAKSQALPRM